jgi:hypothetical protein
MKTGPAYRAVVVVLKKGHSTGRRPGMDKACLRDWSVSRCDAAIGSFIARATLRQ